MTNLDFINAKVVQILDWYERPELVLLEGPKSSYILAVRSGDLNSPSNKYIGGGMSIKRLRDYANGKCDLRFAIAHANLRQFWTFIYDGSQETVEITQIQRSDNELKISLPQPGLFAVEHEIIEIAASHIPDTVEEFTVDGGWDLGEFSSFYSQIEDIYYLSSDIDRFEDPSTSTDEKKVISEAFERPWNGGGSYVAFYKKVANDNDYHAPLRVSGIKYNSPGYVSIHARAEPFAKLMTMLQNYADNEYEIIRASNALGRYMSVQGMKTHGYSFGMMDIDQKLALHALAQKLAIEIPQIQFQTLLEMAKNDILTASRVLESIYNRLKRLYEFFDRGRVSHASLNFR